jgi:hypothetical protein
MVDFRRQQSAVRSGARDLLARYRAERLAKRGLSFAPAAADVGAVERSAAAFSVAEAPGSAIVDSSLPPAEPDERSEPAPAPVARIRPKAARPRRRKRRDEMLVPMAANAPEIDAPSAEEPVPPSAVAEPAADPTAHETPAAATEETADVPAADEAVAADVEPAPATADAPPPSPRRRSASGPKAAPVVSLRRVSPRTRAPRPLGGLPGIGPGMVWRLEQLGLADLADLAQCDVDALREKLGKLGNLVPLEEWIKLAREGSGEERR